MNSVAAPALGSGWGTKDHPYIQAVSSFASKCGIAFQLQDDIWASSANRKL
jgi:geranylgeranyl pyrophosphate synthase